MSRKMHIAATGKQAGQWVTCAATTQCKVGGAHTTATSLQEAKKWSGKKKLEEVTGQDYVDFLQTKISNPVATPTKTSPKRANVGLQRETVDERTQRYASENNLDGKVALENDFRIKTRLRWQAFHQAAIQMGVEIPLDKVKEAGQYFAQGGRDFDFKGIEMKIRPEKLQEFKAKTQNYVS